jgi:hypothetical protein
MLARFSVLAVALVPVFGCGPGGKSGVDAHVIHTTDSGSTKDGSNTNSSCAAMSSYGTVTLSQQGAEGSGTGSSEYLGYFGQIDNTTGLELDLYAGDGVFGTTAGSAITTGTFTISSTNGDDSWANCGACIVLDAAIDGSGNVGATYIAISGTLTITSTSTTGDSGTLAGSVSNLVLQHIAEGTDGSGYATQTIDADGCMSALGSASFTSPVTALMQ